MSFREQPSLSSTDLKNSFDSLVESFEYHRHVFQNVSYFFNGLHALHFDWNQLCHQTIYITHQLANARYIVVFFGLLQFRNELVLCVQHPHDIMRIHLPVHERFPSFFWIFLQHALLVLLQPLAFKFLRCVVDSLLVIFKELLDSRRTISLCISWSSLNMSLYIDSTTPVASYKLGCVRRFDCVTVGVFLAIDSFSCKIINSSRNVSRGTNLFGVY